MSYLFSYHRFKEGEKLCLRRYTSQIIPRSLELLLQWVDAFCMWRRCASCGREGGLWWNYKITPKFPPLGLQYNPLLLSVYGVREGCEYDGRHFVIRLQCMVKVKRFCRWNEGPKLVNLEFIKREITNGRPDLIRQKPLKVGLGSS